MRLKLAQGEQVIARTRPSPWVLFWPCASALVLLAAGGFAFGWLGSAVLPPPLQQWQPLFAPAAALLGAALLFRLFLRPLLRWQATRYVLTNLRLIHRRGMTRRSEYDVQLEAVRQVGITQSLAQRILGSGTLTLDLGHGRSVAYRAVPRVAVFKDYVDEALGDLPRTALFDGQEAGSPLGQAQWHAAPGPFRPGLNQQERNQPAQHWRGEAV